MGRTSIAWTVFTLNLAWGCSKVSEECRNCYMFRLSYRFGKNPELVIVNYRNQNQGPLDARLLNLDKPRSKLRSLLSHEDKVFVNSMSDTFHEDIPFEIIDEWFALFREFPNKQFQVLTKRPERMAEYFKTRECPNNVWLGTSVGTSRNVYRIDILRQIKCKIHFVSFEPLLESIPKVDLTNIQWAIVGGESGDKSEHPRPMKPEWAEELRAQCEAQRVPYFFKQMGGIGGDGAGGNFLNGEQYMEFPDYENKHLTPKPRVTLGQLWQDSNNNHV